MIFTSGTQALQGRTVNHDPEPGVGRHDGRRIANHVTQEQERVKSYAPRPEYEVLDNPILAEFRKDSQRYSPEDYVLWLDADRYTLQQIDHARRVLIRLANLPTP